MEESEFGEFKIFAFFLKKKKKKILKSFACQHEIKLQS